MVLTIQVNGWQEPQVGDGIRSSRRWPQDRQPDFLAKVSPRLLGPVDRPRRVVPAKARSASVTGRPLACVAHTRIAWKGSSIRCAANCHLHAFDGRKPSFHTSGTAASDGSQYCRASHTRESRTRSHHADRTGSASSPPSPTSRGFRQLAYRRSGDYSPNWGQKTQLIGIMKLPATTSGIQG